MDALFYRLLEDVQPKANLFNNSNIIQKTKKYIYIPHKFNHKYVIKYIYFYKKIFPSNV